MQSIYVSLFFLLCDGDGCEQEPVDLSSKLPIPTLINSIRLVSMRGWDLMTCRGDDRGASTCSCTTPSACTPSSPSLFPSRRLAYLSHEQKGLVPTLTELLQDLNNDAFVLRSARTLIGRVSGHDTQNIVNAFGGGVHDDGNMMNVA